MVINLLRIIQIWIKNIKRNLTLCGKIKVLVSSYNVRKDHETKFLIKRLHASILDIKVHAINFLACPLRIFKTQFSWSMPSSE